MSCSILPSARSSASRKESWIGRFSPINAIIKESLDLVDKLSKRKEHVTGVPTGFDDSPTTSRQGFKPPIL